MSDNEEEPELFPPDLNELLEVELKYKEIKEFKDPRKAPINLEQLHKLAAIMARQDEIAAFFGISKSTFKRRLTDYPEVRDAYESGRERFRMTLRRRMVSIAMSPRKDAGRMCIWLSKQELGMREKADLSVTGDERTPGMSFETVRVGMAELMGEDPNDPEAGTEDDGTED